MFDDVRVRPTPETVRLGLAGFAGQVFGETVPSITGVDVIGGNGAGKAYNVAIDGKSSDLWFAPEIIEVIDHAAGTDVRVGDTRLVRNTDGSWSETRDERST